MYSTMLYSVALFGCLLSFSTASRLPRRFCSGGTKITDVPILDRRMLDGVWNSQFVQTLDPIGDPVNSKTVWQGQGSEGWTLDWNVNGTGMCTFRIFEDNQIQTGIDGPFLPCYSSRQLFPVKTPLEEYIFSMPSENIIILYNCQGTADNNNLCSVKPSVRVSTRTKDLTRKDIKIIKENLKILGVELRDLLRVNPRTNRCKLPLQRQRNQRKFRNYGRNARRTPTYGGRHTRRY